MTGARPAAGAPGPSPAGRRRETVPKSPRSAVRAAWDRHQDLLGGAGSLVTTTGLASAIGFAYWTLSGLRFSQEAVGYGAAAVSAMNLLGTGGMLGLGTVLIGELPRRTSRSELIS